MNLKKIIYILATALVMNIGVGAMPTMPEAYASAETVTETTVETATAAAAQPTASPEATEAPAAEYELSRAYTNYVEIVEFLAENFIDETLTADDILKKGLSKYLDESGEIGEFIKATISSLDSYSTLYTADEYAQFENSMNNAFYGIGVTLEQDGEYVKIVEISSTQAQEAGIEAGDMIVAVDGVDVVGWSVSDVRNKVIGELGTSVKITVLRNGEELELVTVRTEVRSSTVNYQVLDGDIGYIKISSFGSNTGSEFSEALENLDQKGVTKIILDLRNNGGGVVTQAVSVAQNIVPEGKIIDVKFRNEQYNVSYTSTLAETNKDYVVLVNGNTASSSEILASAIQDSGAGILLGEQTFGKAVVQSSISLENGSIIYLTIGQYITRNGNEINGIGLTPDVEVTNTKTQIDATQYTKFDFRTRWSLGDTGSSVRAAKERLSLLGYYIGSTDNETFNTDLQTAIKEFQLDNGITPYGVLDVVTQVVLEENFEDLDIYEDTQFEEAYKLLSGETDLNE